jgi:hypothetical protein
MNRRREMTYKPRSGRGLRARLAIIEITGELDGACVLGDFPFVSIGDSDEVGIGDEIRVLGYPGIGGDTITFTRGAVSGFTSDRSVGDRAWIKTDATIAGGNSGGLAVNEDGELIGVPSVVGSGSDSGFADCRVLEDTNGDNVVDDQDSCIPVGGFINGIRAGEAGARPHRRRAEQRRIRLPVLRHRRRRGDASGGYDTGDILFSNLVFSPDVTSNDEPTDLEAAASGAGCNAVLDYEGMQDGMNWDAIWFVNGEQNDEGSIIGDTRIGGETGNWWVCIFDEDTGRRRPLRTHHQIEARPRFDAIFVGDDHDWCSSTSTTSPLGHLQRGSPSGAQGGASKTSAPTSSRTPAPSSPSTSLPGPTMSSCVTATATTSSRNTRSTSQKTGTYTVTDN